MTQPDEIDEPGAFLDSLAVEMPRDDQAIVLILDFLIGRHAPDQLATAILPRLGDLRGVRGEVILGLIEGLARDDLCEGLADALVALPSLAPDRTWMALEILEGTGHIEQRPALVELREDIEDLLADDAALSDLAREIEADPDTIPAAVDALDRIEPGIRREIIAGIGREAASPSLIVLLENLSESRDEETRAVSASALRSLRERQWRGRVEAAKREIASTDSPPPLLASVIGPLDGEGRASIALIAATVGHGSVVCFDCDVRDGIISASLEGPFSPCDAMDRWEEIVESLGPEASRDCPISAWLLLTGAAWLSGETLPISVRTALAEAFGPWFDARPIFAPPECSPRNAEPDAEIRADARAVLARRSSWRDDSDLARRLAVEIVFREGDLPPDPVRDPGPFRVLFEGRILGRIELYRRMLLWSAMVWRESGESKLSQAARRIAEGITDPQNAVPGYPFMEELMIRSLSDGRSIVA